MVVQSPIRGMFNLHCFPLYFGVLFVQYYVHTNRALADLPFYSLRFCRGKMVGGSSGINSMAWVRPTRYEIDVWSRLGVGSEWQWYTMLPYMMKTEHVYLGNSSAFPGATQPSGFNSAVSGRIGPVQVTFDNTYTALRPPFVQSLINIGGIFNDDAVSNVFLVTQNAVCSRMFVK